MMARIPFVEYDQASDELRKTYDTIIGSRGNLFNIYKVLGNNPKAVAGVFNLSIGTYRSGDVDAGLTELAYLYTSTLNQCHY
jgi:alkylhydroperoxidase family enzyme